MPRVRKMARHNRQSRRGRDTKRGGTVLKKFNGLMTSASPHWATPSDVYADLNREFCFDFDPCPLRSESDGLSAAWGKSTFVNPPYGREIGKWLRKGFEEWQSGNTVVFLIPSRTDTKWWHEYCMKATEIRYVRGRLKFGGSKCGAPFPSAIVIFKKDLIKEGERL